MKKRDLRRLRRQDLLEMLLDLTKENEQLQKINQQLEQSLQDRTISLQEIGSVAEAALQLNGIFQVAQSAADQYLFNVQMRCQQMEEDTKRKCEEMLGRANSQVVQDEEQEAEA